MPNSFAPKGAIFVCGACGKTSSNLYGDGSRGWDASCMLNAVLCDEVKRFASNGMLVYHAATVEPLDAALTTKGGGDGR